MFRVLLSAVALWALLPATLCGASCTMDPASANPASPPAAASHAMPSGDAGMPCHGAPGQPTPAAPEHDAEECPGCQLQLVAAANPAPSALQAGLSIPLLPALAVQPYTAASRSAHPPREPPGLRHDPFARRNAPLLN